MELKNALLADFQNLNAISGFIKLEGHLCTKSQVDI